MQLARHKSRGDTSASHCVVQAHILPTETVSRLPEDLQLTLVSRTTTAIGQVFVVFEGRGRRTSRALRALVAEAQSAEHPSLDLLHVALFLTIRGAARCSIFPIQVYLTSLQNTQNSLTVHTTADRHSSRKRNALRNQHSVWEAWNYPVAPAASFGRQVSRKVRASAT